MSITQSLTRPLTAALTRAITSPGVGGGGAAPYLGVIATRGYANPTTLLATYTQSFTRTFHKVRAEVTGTGIRLLFQNWYGSAETAPGAAMTLSASVKLGGVRTRVTFSGVNDGTVPDGGSLVSDLIPVVPSVGDELTVYAFRRCAAGFLWCGNADHSNGDQCLLGTGALTDNVMSEEPGNTSPIGSWPIILGETAAATVALVGDSRVGGVNTDVPASFTGNALGDRGEIARSVGPDYGYLCVSIGGEGAEQFATSSTKRAPLLDYATHVICNYGINDIRVGGATAAQVKASLQAAWAILAQNGRKVYQTTITPDTTIALNAMRTEVNDWIRTTPAGIDGYIEVADVVETARNSGVWKDGYSSDGLHENATGYQAIEDADVFPTLSR